MITIFAENSEGILRNTAFCKTYYTADFEFLKILEFIKYKLQNQP